MKRVTLWYKVSRNDDKKVHKVSFNHLEDGWNMGKYPKPKSPSFSNQKAWENEEWGYTHKYLNDKNVVVNVNKN